MPVSLSTRSSQSPDAVIDRLRQALGADNVLTSAEDRRFYSEDVFSSGVPPLAVVQPRTVEAVQVAAAICSEAALAIVPRGGGMSYTSGYLPISPDSVTFDLSHLNRIVELNAADMYVTVEVGCTWDALNQALAPLGLRTPYWGPVSGQIATVGGALSQNSAFWGAVRGGVVSETVLGMDVVLADGRLLGVGAHGGQADAPRFFRHYGPELTGLFTGDCGALGLKVRATFPLVQRPPEKGAISFSFDTPYALLDALSAVSRLGLISEAAAFDQGQQEERVTQAKVPFAKLVETFFAVAKTDGIPAALSMAAHGQRFLANVAHSLHLILEAPSKAELKRQLAKVREIARAKGGSPIEPTIGRVLSAQPFPDPDGMLTAHRFLPVHGVIPHSIAGDVYRDILKIFAHHEAAAKQLQIRTGVFSISVGAGTILIEPTWHWTGAFLQSHPRLYGRSPEDFAHLSPNPEAESLVRAMREEITQLFMKAGAGHFQIGKHYPYQASRGTINLQVIQDFKRLVDPQGLMNPGALGFSRAAV